MIKQVDLRDPDLFPSRVRKAFMKQKAEGGKEVSEYIKRAYRKLAKEDSDAPELKYGEELYIMQHYYFVLADALLSKISEKDKRKYFPYCDMEVLFYGDMHENFQLRLSSVSRLSTPGGTAYYSPLKPTITVNGEKKIVAFYRHAIERIGERRFANRNYYSTIGQFHSFLRYYTYYETAKLKPSERNPEGLAFTAYERCMEDFPSMRHVTEILGDVEDKEKYIYRIGYFPFIIYKDFAVAPTLLYPGFTSTPEYRCILNAEISEEKREVLLARAKKESEVTLSEDRDYSLLKFFHEHGVPQVKKHEENLYRTPG